MTGSTASSDNRPPPPSGGRRGAGLGLSAKLLLLTALFVMLAEVLIFVPSIANFRINWLMDRLEAAQIASIAAKAAPDGALPEMLREELLRSASVRGVAMKTNDQRLLILAEEMPPDIDEHYDLRTDGVIKKIWPKVKPEEHAAEVLAAI